jgi:hypothetical protein
MKKSIFQNGSPKKTKKQVLEINEKMKMLKF